MRNSSHLCLTLGFLAVLAGCGSANDGSGNSAGGASSAGAGGHPGGSGDTSGGSSGSLGSSGSANGGASAAGGGGGGMFSSKLPAASILGQLSMSDLDELCTETIAGPLVAVARSGACLNKALFSAATSGPHSDADAKLACHAYYDSCSQQAVARSVCPTFSATCLVTVGEYFTCVNDEAAAYAAAYAVFPSCDAVTVALLKSTPLDTPADPPEPASCALLDPKCPDAAGGGQ